jgi:hypothetical protein
MIPRLDPSPTLPKRCTKTHTLDHFSCVIFHRCNSCVVVIPSQTIRVEINHKQRHRSKRQNKAPRTRLHNNCTNEKIVSREFLKDFRGDDLSHRSMFPKLVRDFKRSSSSWRVFSAAIFLSRLACSPPKRAIRSPKLLFHHPQNLHEQVFRSVVQKMKPCILSCLEWYGGESVLFLTHRRPMHPSRRSPSR